MEKFDGRNNQLLILLQCSESLNSHFIGQQAGFLGAAYLIGNVPGTAVFSLLSDFVGRKSVLLVTLLIGTGFMVLFGFSLNFAWALASRMLWGFADGNIGVIKALIAEVWYQYQ